MARTHRLLLWLLPLALLVTPASLFAGERVATRVLVRAVSRDAKIIGTNVGGARITVQNAETGEILASGLQLGGTGDTERIMIAPRPRGGTVYETEGAAGFVAELMLAEPTVVEISATGPLGTAQSMQRTTKTLLVVPGQDIMGEGVLLEIHGFTIALLEPDSDTVFRSGNHIDVRIRLTMT